MSDPFADLPRGHYGAILADPPWTFRVWADSEKAHGSASAHYNTMSIDELKALDVGVLAAADCTLFMWICWPNLVESLDLMTAWGFGYKTCAFSWIKGDASQIEFFHDEVKPYMGLGYWTRANSEVCLLGTRGKPKRLNADVRQAIIAPRREHSRKPNEIHDRIERLVTGPYLELFARAPRTGWDVWGNQTDKFAEAAE